MRSAICPYKVIGGSPNARKGGAGHGQTLGWMCAAGLGETGTIGFRTCMLGAGGTWAYCYRCRGAGQMGTLLLTCRYDMSLEDELEIPGGVIRVTCNLNGADQQCYCALLEGTAYRPQHLSVA